MLKSLGIGTALMILAIIATMVLCVFHISIALYAVTGGLGCLCWLLAAIPLGLLVTGDKIRAEYYGESNEEYARRQQTSWHLFLAGLPCIVVAFVFYLCQL